MIPQPRVLHRGANGLDVFASKRALRKWEAAKGFTTILKWPPTSHYGDAAHWACVQFQRHHAGLHDDGVLGPHTYAALYPWLDAYDRGLLRLYVRRHPPLTRRDRVMNQARWCLDNHDLIFYGQTRPIPLGRFRDHVLPLTTDCSGAIIGMHFAAGAPDPGGNGYNGQGFTGSFLGHLPHIAHSDLHPCDIVVFGYYPGVHAVLYLGDGECYTHGHQGIPDDPRRIALSDMESYFRQVGMPTVTCLRSPLA